MEFANHSTHQVPRLKIRPLFSTRRRPRKVFLCGERLRSSVSGSLERPKLLPKKPVAKTKLKLSLFLLSLLSTQPKTSKTTVFPGKKNTKTYSNPSKKHAFFHLSPPFHPPRHPTLPFGCLQPSFEGLQLPLHLAPVLHHEPLQLRHRRVPHGAEPPKASGVW